MDKTNLTVHTVILDKSIAEHPYLIGDIVQKTDIEGAGTVYHMTCTEINTAGMYLSATVSSVPNGEPRPVLLNHSFVVAILECLNLRNQPGFVG